MSNDKALVMGASGFLGSHVVKALAGQERDIRIFTRETSDISTIRHLDFEHVYGDVRDKDSVARALKDCSVVYYCVVDTRAWARNIKPLQEINLTGLRNVLDACMLADVKRFVYTSTFMTIGLNPSGIASEKDEFNWYEEAPEYIRVRVDAEKLFMDYCQKGLPGVACNVAITFGSYDTQPTPHGMVLALVVLGRFPFYWDASFSSVGIRDAAEALLLAEKNGGVGERYLITEKRLHLKDLFQIGLDSVGSRKRLFILPIPLMYISCFVFQTMTRFTGRDTRFSYTSLRLSRKTKDFDNSKAIKELKWKPRPVEEAIAEGARWFVSDESSCLELSMKDF